MGGPARRPSRIGVTSARCSSRCTACTSTVGSSLRRRTAASSAAVTVPRRSGPASRVAAATASCTARLMPTPPTGDIACAASPMHSRPSTCQRLSRFSRTSRCLTSSIDVRASTRSARSGISAATSRRKRLDPSGAQLRVGALPGDVGDLEVVPARDDQREAAPTSPRGQGGRVVLRCARQPEPPGVDGNGELPDGEVRLLPSDRPAAVAGHDQVGADLTRRPRPACGSAPRAPVRPRARARSPRCASAA